MSTLHEIHIIGDIVLAAHLAIIISLSIRVIMQRRPVGVALAWIILVFILPLVGAILYLIMGEKRVGKHRVERAEVLLGSYERWLKEIPQDTSVDWSNLSRECEPLSRLAEAELGMPVMAGNKLHLLDDAEGILRSIIADIDRAKSTCHMEFYIWHEGGTADEVCEALVRAKKRGVVCRVMLDAVGSKKFLKSKLARHLRKNGIELISVLTVGLFKMAFVRADLRFHRKVVVIDGEVAYTGSLNLVDPRYFKQTAGVGQWVDAMVRVEGPIVEALGVLFLFDWGVETGQGIDIVRDTCDIKALSPAGTANVQMVPSGPGHRRNAIHQLLLTSIYSARKSLIMTTPYFVPDDSLLIALKSAAEKGVDVTIILPDKIDSLLVRYACRSYFDELVASGVKILRFKGGLLHTKSLIVDDDIALFGTVNLDMRSFYLDFEVTLFVYDSDFVARLRTLQQQYAKDSELIELKRWRKRPTRARFVENVAYLFSPLL